MTIVVLVCSIDQGLQFRYIVRVGKVDNINGNVVLSKALAKSLKLHLLLLEWVTAENDDSRLRVLVHTMFQ